MNKAFRSTCDRAVQKLFEGSPFTATAYGDTAFADRLDDYTSGGRSRRRASVEECLSELRRFEKTPLSPAEQFDLRILEEVLEVPIRNESELRLSERDACRYVLGLGDALYGLLQLKGMSEAQRADALIGRLSELEAYLLTASTNLGGGYDVPAVWTETAIAMLRGLDAFFLTDLLPFAQGLPADVNELACDAVEGSRRLLLRFATFLQETLLPTCDGSFACGRTQFEYLLTRYNGSNPVRLLDLMGTLDDRVHEARRATERASQAVGSRSLRKAMHEVVQARTPALGRVEAAYQRQIERAVDCLIKLDAVTVPEHDLVTVEALPAYRWPLCTTGATKLSSLARGAAPRVLIRPVSKKTAPDSLRNDLLAEHSLPQVQARAVMLGYPGAALQLISASQSTSRIRRMARAASTTAAWELVALDVMEEKGFLRDPKTILAAQRERLQAVVEMELDLKLHLRLLSFEEAVERLIGTCRLRPVAADAVIRRIVLNPSDATARALGYDELRQLRIRATDPTDRPDRVVIDKLIGQGGATIGRMREAILK